jgi:hypothetical protein
MLGEVMPWNIIQENKARCKHCGDLLISSEDQVEDTCTCGKLKVSGGKGYLGRTGTKGVDYEELSELNFGDPTVPNVNAQPGDYKELQKNQNPDRS